MFTFHNPELAELAELARSVGATMSLDPTTTVVNGQRFTAPTRNQYMPTGYGPSTTGVPQVSPSMPPFLGGSPTNNSMMEQVGGYGTAGNNALMAATAAANPWSPRLSPVLPAIIGLLLAIVLLKKIHWRETIEGGGQLGPVSAKAEEKVD